MSLALVNPPRARNPPSGPRVLIVEDSPVQAELLRRSVEAAGYATRTATNGVEGLALAEDFLPAVIVSDVNMPLMDGYTLCQRLRSHPRLGATPVILLTSLSDTGDVIQGLNAGADGYVTKPYDEALLLACIAQQLKRRAETPATGPLQMEVTIGGEVRTVQARSYAQVVNLLVSTYESAVLQNRELIRAQDALTQANEAQAESVRALAATNAELRQTQAQLIQAAKLASLGQLVAGIAHEINNPLAFVVSHQETVVRALDAVVEQSGAALAEASTQKMAKARERLGEMTIGLARIQDLVLKLRTFSRLDQGKLERIDIGECIDSVLTLLQYRLGKRIVVERDLRCDERVRGSPGAINQVLMNLLANAIDAIEGEGTIRIATVRDGDMLCLTIEDTGCGMAAPVREHLFEPFFTTKAVGQGVGLGLSIAYGIVGRHGGTITVRSAEGEGTTMTIRIPFQPPASAGVERS